MSERPECSVCAQLRSSSDRQVAHIAELEAGIQRVIDGDYDRPRGEIYRADGKHSKHDTCVHGPRMYEDCEGCLCEALSSLLNKGEDDAQPR